MDRWDWDEEFDDMEVGSAFVSEAQEVEDEMAARLRAAAAWLSQVVAGGSPVRVEAEISFCPWSQAATARRAEAAAERPSPSRDRLQKCFDSPPRGLILTNRWQNATY